MSDPQETLASFSDALAEAAAKGGAAVYMIDARRRLPASGVGYSADLVLTADHVIEREEDIYVTSAAGERFKAVLAGRDPGSDLALLRVEGGALAVIETAAATARVGQIVLALGRPSADGLQASLGVVSAIGGPARTGRGGLLESFLRTDAIPYPGFSGGPLVDAAGRALGLNTSGLGRGASLVIPAGAAWQTAAMLAQHGRVRRGYLGVRSQVVNLPAAQQETLGRAQESGLLLVGVEAGSPAEAAGLLLGDILVAFDAQPLSDPDQLLAFLAGDAVGRPAEIGVLRGGQPQTITVTIGERKD